MYEKKWKRTICKLVRCYRKRFGCEKWGIRLPEHVGVIKTEGIAKSNPFIFFRCGIISIIEQPQR